MSDLIEPETAIEKARVHYKRLTSNYWLRASFCKKCGRDNRDFIAPEWAWKTVQSHIKYGNVLCYDCFFDAYWNVTADLVIWRLTPNDR